MTTAKPLGSSRFHRRRILWLVRSAEYWSGKNAFATPVLANSRTTRPQNRPSRGPRGRQNMGEF